MEAAGQRTTTMFAEPRGRRQTDRESRQSSSFPALSRGLEAGSERLLEVTVVVVAPRLRVSIGESGFEVHGSFWTYGVLAWPTIAQPGLDALSGESSTG